MPACFIAWYNQPMDMQRLLNSRRMGSAVLGLCRAIPPGLGLRLTQFVAARIAASRETQAVQAVRSNQWVIHREALTPAELDRTALECWQSIARSFYELFHTCSSPAQLQSLVVFSPEMEALIARSQEAHQGMILAGVHLSGFDIVAQATAQRGLRAGVLSLPQASPAVEWQHSFRRQAGMEILPPSLANLRRAIQRLEAGEFMLTGIDRPMPDLKHCLKFFGRPAHLPTHHITLALRARVPIIVMAPVRGPDDRYRLYLSEELFLRPYSDRDQEIECNAERVLETAAALISQAPRQWAVTRPVWPEVSPS